MAKLKVPAPIDTSAGTAAYALATLHAADVGPRLPTGTLADLAADLTLLGASPNPPSVVAPAAPGAPNAAPNAPPAPAAPTLVEAMTSAVALVSAIHGAIQGSKASPTIRKAYGASAKTASKEPKAVIAEGQKILARATLEPTEALSLGILPADTAALDAALAALTAAETAAKGTAGAGGTTAKERRAAETRMHEAVARIAGVGVLAFATNPTVRAAFEALKPVKKKK